MAKTGETGRKKPFFDGKTTAFFDFLERNFTRRLIF
jgi:hypothetical protein